MCDLKFSGSLQALSQEYYHHKVTLAEYREQRSIILMQIDEQYNGVSSPYNGSKAKRLKDKSNAEQSVIKKAVSFFKK